MPERHRHPPPSGPIVRKVRLKNFKSVQHQDVPLGQLTLLVGENSAGKSSVLQAVRLLRQAIRAASPGDAFPLNGELISMGTIDDLRSAQANTDDAVSIGVEVSSPDFPRLPWLRRGFGGFTLNREAPRGDASLTWNVNLAGTAPDEPGSTQICGHSLSVADPDDNRRLTLCLQRTAPDGSTTSLPTGPTWSDYIDCDQSIRGDLYSEDLSGEDSNKRFQIIGAALSGAMPRALLTEQPADRALAALWTHRWVEILQGPPAGLENDQVPLLLGESEEPVNDLNDVLEFAAAAIARLLEDFGDPSIVLRQRILDDRYFPAISEFFVSEHDMFWRDTGPFDEDLDWLIKSLIKSIAESLQTEIRMPLLCEEREWEGIESFAEHVANFVNRRIHYLGPLRAAPEIVMPTSPAARAGDIGSSGEFTAAVLRSLGTKPVNVPMPDRQHDTLPLVEAVEAWATHLGLVDSVTIGDLPAIGLTVRVRPHGLGNDLPLPSVGVGVSQLMPVLVRCLLAEPGSLILLEQPELHLHPGLQQRLADFFVAIARSGRQLIVETHSEYFVSRIRRRIAAAADDEVRSLTKIIFAERDPETGITDYRDIELSPYGDIDDWPKGFFDQAAEEEREIIRSGLQKRADR